MSTNQHTPGPFLICDLRPGWSSHPYVTFWRPKNANYAYPLSWAGDYTEAEVMEGGGYYAVYEAGHLIRFPVERSAVEPLAVDPAVGIIDGDSGPVIRNTAALRQELRKLAYAPALAAIAKAEGRS